VPWIVQIGHNRAGWYSHEWVERLFGIRYAEGHSATRIHPEFQHLRVGDKIPYSPFNSIPVVAIAPERHLIIGNSVAWVLQDLGDGRTRLIVRTRGHGWFKALFRKIPLLRQHGGVIDYVVGEPLHHYMENGMHRHRQARAKPSRRSATTIAARGRSGKHLCALRCPLIGGPCGAPTGNACGSQAVSHARVVLDRVLHDLRPLGRLQEAV
jgi:hypothetical protein